MSETPAPMSNSIRREFPFTVTRLLLLCISPQHWGCRQQPKMDQLNSKGSQTVEILRFAFGGVCDMPHSAAGTCNSQYLHCKQGWPDFPQLRHLYWYYCAGKKACFLGCLRGCCGRKVRQFPKSTLFTRLPAFWEKPATSFSAASASGSLVTCASRLNLLACCSPQNTVPSAPSSD